MTSTTPGPALRLLLFAALVGWGLTGSRLAATTVVPPEFPELVNGSDYVVRARVKAVTAEASVKDGKELIHTKVELEVLEVIAGQPPEPLVLTMLGGQVGDRKLTVQGAPVFYVGAEDVLFIKGNGRAFSPLYAMMHGQYPVMADAKRTGRRYMNRSNLVPLLTADEVAMPMAQGDLAERLRRLRDPGQALTPEQFVQAIKSARRAYRR